MSLLGATRMVLEMVNTARYGEDYRGQAVEKVFQSWGFEGAPQRTLEETLCCLQQLQDATSDLIAEGRKRL